MINIRSTLTLQEVDYVRPNSRFLETGDFSTYKAIKINYGSSTSMKWKAFHQVQIASSLPRYRLMRYTLFLVSDLTNALRFVCTISASSFTKENGCLAFSIRICT
jgi:hypothetical protein